MRRIGFLIVLALTCLTLGYGYAQHQTGLLQFFLNGKFVTKDVLTYKGRYYVPIEDIATAFQRRETLQTQADGSASIRLLLPEGSGSLLENEQQYMVLVKGGYDERGVYIPPAWERRTLAPLSGALAADKGRVLVLGPAKPERELVLLDNSILRDGTSAYVVGSVRNNGLRPIPQVRVSLLFFNAGGDQVGFGSDIMLNLERGGTWRFRVSIPNPSDVASYKIKIEGE